MYLCMLKADNSTKLWRDNNEIVYLIVVNNHQGFTQVG